MAVRNDYIHAFTTGGPELGGDWSGRLKMARSTDRGINWNVGNFLSHSDISNVVVNFGAEYTGKTYVCFTYTGTFELKFAESDFGSSTWTDHTSTTFPPPSYYTVDMDMDFCGGYYFEKCHMAISQYNADPLVKGVYLRSSVTNTSDWSDDSVIDDACIADYVSIAANTYDDTYIYVSYQDYENNNLKFARNESGYPYTFEVQTIDSSSSTGLYSSIGSNGTNVYISYYDATNDTLKFIKNTNSGVSASWSTPSIVDSSSANIGEYSSLALVGSDDIYISYYDRTSKNLKFARSLNGGSSWTIKTVDDSGKVALIDTEIQVDNGVVYISYAVDESPTIRNWMIAKSLDGGDTW